MRYGEAQSPMELGLRQAQLPGGEASIAAMREQRARDEASAMGFSSMEEMEAFMAHQRQREEIRQAQEEENALQKRALRDKQIGEQAHAAGLDEGINKGRKAEVDYRNGLVTNKARDIAATVGQQPQGQQVSAPVANSREMYAKAQRANVA